MMDNKHIEMIVWQDAVSEDGWIDLDQAEGQLPHYCQTVGWVLSDEGSCVTLAGSVDTGTDMGEVRTCGAVWTIPKGMILSRVRLSEESIDELSIAEAEELFRAEQEEAEAEAQRVLEEYATLDDEED